MKGKIALALVALAAGMGACGDSEEAEPRATVGPPTRTAPARSPSTDPDRGCALQRIDTSTLYEGTCTEGATQYVVVNRDGELRLESLVASIEDISVESTVGTGDDAVRPEHGVFVRFTLTVRNRREYPQNFDVGQSMLAVGESAFREAEEAALAHAGALVARGGGRIEPHGVLRGDVIFDVPPESVEQIATAGRLLVANFGERPGERPAEGAPEPRERLEEDVARMMGGRLPPDVIQVGQLRLYAGSGGAAR